MICSLMCFNQFQKIKAKIKNKIYKNRNRKINK
jgi:hypothetical protein